MELLYTTLLNYLMVMKLKLFEDNEKSFAIIMLNLDKTSK